jgi:hypothetical protein
VDAHEHVARRKILGPAVFDAAPEGVVLFMHAERAKGG